MSELFDIPERIAALSVTGIKNDVIIRAFAKMFDGEATIVSSFSAYTEICTVLIKKNLSLAEYLRNAVLTSEDSLLLEILNNKSKFAYDTLKNDLRVISVIATTSEEIKKTLLRKYVLADVYNLPDFDSGFFHYDADYFLRYARIYGIGIFTLGRAFRCNSDKTFSLIENFERIKLSQLEGYESQQDKIIRNTERFLQGKPAQNALLYGDRGTGKSSTVKALPNKYKQLKLIYLEKNNVELLPEIFTKLSKSPLKFIVFLDDITFEETDNGYGILKRTLEGSVESKPNNVLIYATTNHRHIVKENENSRDRTIFHRGDSIDETVSLTDRFGLYLTFSAPDQELYFSIVKRIASDNNISVTDSFLKEAEQFALQRGGRSPRIAKQFVEQHVL